MQAIHQRLSHAHTHSHAPRSRRAAHYARRMVYGQPIYTALRVYASAARHTHTRTPRGFKALRCKASQGIDKDATPCDSCMCYYDSVEQLNRDEAAGAYPAHRRGQRKGCLFLFHSAGTVQRRGGGGLPA